MTSFKSTLAIAATFFVSSALAGFDTSSQSNVAVYWGMLHNANASNTCTNTQTQARTQPVKQILRRVLRSTATVRSQQPDPIADFH